MKMILKRAKWMLVLFAVVVGTMTLGGRAEKAIPLSSYSEAVDKAVSDENLRAVAAKSTDAEVLLGLGYVAPTGSAARREILEKAVKARPDYAPAAIVVGMAMKGVDESSIAELIKNDASNALGYYLQGAQLRKAEKEKEALDAFRKGAACSELRFYGTTTANALFKALDALNLKGRDRLAALSWTASRMGNFYISEIQPMLGLSGLAEKADLPTRKEISDLLLVLGGQLFSTNFQNREFAQWAVRGAFQLKAEIAADEKSPTMNGYVTVVQALVSVDTSWPGIAEKNDLPLETAQFAPFRISESLAWSDPLQRESAMQFWLKVNVAEKDKPAFEKAKQDVIKAAQELVAVCLSDPDTIIGAYLKGIPPAPKGAVGPWVSNYTYVERLMTKGPEVFKSVAVYNQARLALQKASESDPGRQNDRRLLQLAVAIYEYASDHHDALPENLEVLYKNGKYLKDASVTQSAFTGKAFVYVGAGEKLPEKGDLILAYDDKEQDGLYHCAMASGCESPIRVNEVRKQLQQRGK